MKKPEDIKDNDKETQPKKDPGSLVSQGDGNGVIVSEDYQKQAHGMIHKANKHQLNHIRSRISDREDELRKQEQGKNKPAEFNSADMPN